MPVLFILACIALVLALICFIVHWTRKRHVSSLSRVSGTARSSRSTDLPFGRPESDSIDSDSAAALVNSAVRSGGAFKLGLGLTVLGVVLSLWSSATIVSTKNVGVETSFGRPNAQTLTNGFHMILPWNEVTEMDAAIQTDNHIKDANPGCIGVKIAHQAQACVNVSIRWRIVEDTANTLFQDYREFSNVRDSLVTRQLSAELNATFETYDPLAVNESGASTAPDLASLSDTVTKNLQGKVGDQINVLSVIISLVNFDDATQNRINQLQSEIANTRIATQAVKTAAQQALANQALAASLSKDPNVLVSKCFDLMNDMIVKGQALPVGFSCWPGGSSAVVVPATGAEQPK